MWIMQAKLSPVQSNSSWPAALPVWPAAVWQSRSHIRSWYYWRPNACSGSYYLSGSSGAVCAFLLFRPGLATVVPHWAGTVRGGSQTVMCNVSQRGPAGLMRGRLRVWGLLPWHNLMARTETETWIMWWRYTHHILFFFILMKTCGGDIYHSDLFPVF